MTREDVIALAREAGFVIDEEAYARQPNCIFHTWHMIDEGLARFAALVAASEREACARVCEEVFKDLWIIYRMGDPSKLEAKESEYVHGALDQTRLLLNAIRARGNA